MLSDENEDNEEYKKNKEKAEKEWKAFKEKWENFFRTLWEKFWKLTIGFVIAFNIIYYRKNIDKGDGYKDFLDEYTDYLPMPQNMKKDFKISELDSIVCEKREGCCGKGGLFPYNFLCIKEDGGQIKICDFKKIVREEDGKQVTKPILFGNLIQILLAGYLNSMRFYRSILSTYISGKKINGDCLGESSLQTEIEKKNRENFNYMIVVIFPFFCYIFFGASFGTLLSLLFAIPLVVVWVCMCGSAFGNYGRKTEDYKSLAVATLVNIFITGWGFGIYAGAEMIYSILLFPLIMRLETIKKIAIEYSPIALVLYLLLFVAVAFSTLDKTSSTAIFVVFLYLMWELKKKNDSNK